MQIDSAYTAEPAAREVSFFGLSQSVTRAVLDRACKVYGEVTQMNLPGTVDAYPNWSRKLSLSLEELQRDERVQALAAAVCTLRPPAATA